MPAVWATRIRKKTLRFSTAGCRGLPGPIGRFGPDLRHGFAELSCGFAVFWGELSIQPSNKGRVRTYVRQDLAPLQFRLVSLTAHVNGLVWLTYLASPTNVSRGKDAP